MLGEGIVLLGVSLLRIFEVMKRCGFERKGTGEEVMLA
jgi:hypothetical protein